MAERPGPSLPSPSKKRQNAYTVKEQGRFDCIKDALPPHLRPGKVPEPLANLSTPENYRLAILHQQSEDRPPGDGLANLYFVDEIKKVLKGEDAECISHKFIRLSKDGKYGYIAGEPMFTKGRPGPNSSTFILFTLPPTGDGRTLHGRYMWVDAPLAPLTPDEHQYRNIPAAKRALDSQENTPCRAIVFHNFDENLRRTVQEAASSLPDPPTSSKPFPSLSPAHEDHRTSRSSSEDLPARNIEGPVVGNEVNRPSTTNAFAGQAEGDSGRAVILDPDSFVVVKQGPEEYHGARQEHTEETAEQAEALRHGQVVPDPDDDADDDACDMNTNVPASSSSTTAKPFNSAPVPSQEPSKDVPAASRSRKGKERAQEPEETASGSADVATDVIEARLRVEYDSSYASRVAMNEARQTGISQEQLESMVKFDESSNAVDKVDGEEGSAGNTESYQGDQPNGDSSNTSDPEVRLSRLLPYVANPGQGSSSALAQSQPATTDGNPQSSPPLREASPARTETNSDITYDDGPQDDGQDMGGTSAGQDPEQSGPTTPGPAPGDKRKREKVIPSTGSEERPATKHRRPGFEAEDEPSPLPQSRVRRDAISTSRQPLRRWNTDPSLRSGPNREARPMADGMPLRGFRSSNSIPEEEATDAAGSNSLGMATLNSSTRSIADRTGETQDGGRETEPQSDQTPIRLVIEPPRFLIERPANTQASGTLPPTLAADATTMSTNDVQVSPSTEGSVRQASTNSLSNGTYIIKTTYLVRIPEGSAAEESQSTSPSAPPASSRAEPSITPTATPNQSPRARQPVDRATQTDQAATTDTQASSRPVIADGPAPEFLGLLRAWRAAFMNLPDELLAEAGLRITGGGTATQETRVDQTTEVAPNSQIHEEEDYHNLLLSLLHSFRGALSTLSPEILSGVGVEIIGYRSRSRALPNPPPLRGGSDSGRQESGARPSLETSHPDTIDLGQILAFLRDSLKHLSSAATGSTRPSNQASSNFASSLGTFNPPHVNRASGAGHRDRGTEIAGAETKESATNQSNATPSNQPAATDAPGNPPPNESEPVETKPKRKDVKNKSKKGKNKEGSDPSTSSVSPGRSGIATDIEMTILDVQPPPQPVYTPANDPPMPQTAASSGSLQARLPSPVDTVMDTEWDDNKSGAEGSGGTKGGEQDPASPKNKDDGLPSTSAIRNQEHPEQSNPAQPTTTSSSFKQKQPKKSKPGPKGSSVAPAVRPREASPTAAAPPEASLATPTLSGPPADSPPQRIGTPTGQTASAPPTALPPSSRDEPMMVDIESPKRLPERDVNHGAQIPAEETFGEGPIVPDDEGPPPSSSRFVASTTENTNDIPGSNIALQFPQNSTSGIGPAETAVENVTTNAPGDSWSESGLTEEYEDSRANPYRLRDVLHAAAAQDIMNELLPRSSRPSPQPSRDATQSIEANFGLTPTEQPDPRDGTPTPPRTTTPTAPSTVPAVVEQATPGTSVLPEQSAPAGAHDSNEISSPGSEGHHDEGSSHPGADATVQELVNAFGLWSLFYEATPSGTSRTNAPEES